MIFVAAVAAWCSAPLDAVAIVRRSAEVNEADWKAAPKYDFLERDRTEEGTRTYRIMMLLGSLYEELTAVNGKPLSAAEQQQEQRKLEEVISDRRAEPVAKRSARVAKYEQDRTRDHLLMQELARAFKFRVLGEGNLGRNRVYRLQATPRPGYRPPNTETQVLTGMRGKLWIDKNTYQWVRVEAEVVRPVSIVGFLARVQPGTRFELEKMPVDDGIWLPKHFVMKSNTKILFLFHHRTQDDETYFNYRKAAAEQP